MKDHPRPEAVEPHVCRLRVPGEKILKLLDFGIAKFRDGGEDDVTTQTGLFIGTAPYSSPEQIRGQAVDTRSDIYSVGILLFELLTGYRPFTGPSYSLIASHLSTPPPRFADRNQYVEISSEIEDVVLSCLAKEADRRSHPVSCRAFHRASTPAAVKSRTPRPTKAGTTPRSRIARPGLRNDQPYAAIDPGTRYPKSGIRWASESPEPKRSAYGSFCSGNRRNRGIAVAAAV